MAKYVCPICRNRPFTASVFESGKPLPPEMGGGKSGVYEVISCYRHSEESLEPNDKWRFVSTNGEGDLEFEVRDKDVVNFFNSG